MLILAWIRAKACVGAERWLSLLPRVPPVRIPTPGERAPVVARWWIELTRLPVWGFLVSLAPVPSFVFGPLRRTEGEHGSLCVG